MSKRGDEIRDEQAPARNRFEVPEDIRVKYQAVFSNETGVYVLADQLVSLGLFAKLDDSPGQVARHNHAIDLLWLNGILKPTSKGFIDQVDMEKIVMALMNV